MILPEILFAIIWEPSPEITSDHFNAIIGVLILIRILQIRFAFKATSAVSYKNGYKHIDYSK